MANLNGTKSIEEFVTCEFELIFEQWNDPFDSIWLKIVAILAYAVEILASLIMLAFVDLETIGLFGHYRTLINQLLSYLYGGAAVYGIIFCGIRNLRVLIGPLFKELCHLQDVFTRILIWYALLIILMITLTKFMFICVWKRMPTMNDDLLARIALIQAFFFSVFFGITAPFVRKGQSFSGTGVSQETCSGIFDGSGNLSHYNWDPNKTHPYTTIYVAMILLAICLMVFVEIGRHQINLDEPTGMIKAPKNLESALLNFTLTAIIVLNHASYVFFWKKYESLSSNQLEEYPAWMFLFFQQVFVPMVVIIIIALKIILKFGKAMQRELFSESNIGISLQRGSWSYSAETLETTQGYKSQENVTLELNSLSKIGVETQEQEHLPTKQILPLNTEKVELQEPNDEHDLKNIKEIKTELGVAQELQKVATNKGKGKGKGQSNFKKEKFSRPKYILDNKPEGLKQEPRWMEEDKEITRSTLASRHAYKKWKERTKQLRVRKSVRVGLSRSQSYQLQLVQLGLN